jgi:hypothetical protein
MSLFNDNLPFASKCVTLRLLQTQQGTKTFSLKKLHSFVTCTYIAVQREAVKPLKALDL